MQSFKLWLVERSIAEFNVILLENSEGKFKAPPLKIATSCSPEEIEDWIRTKYQEENNRSGPIRSPSMVIVNKLRHECLNYDVTRNSITAAKNRGDITICEKIQMELDLLAKIHETVEGLISKFTFDEKVPEIEANGQVKVDADGEIIYTKFKGFKVDADTIVEKKWMLASNQMYTDEAKEKFEKEKDKNKCYDRKLPAGVRRLDPAPTPTPVSAPAAPAAEAPAPSTSFSSVRRGGNYGPMRRL